MNAAGARILHQHGRSVCLWPYSGGLEVDMPASVSEPQILLPFTTLDDLMDLQHDIVLRSRVMLHILEDQQPRAPDDGEDRPMLSELREALQVFTSEIYDAALKAETMLAGAPRVDIAPQPSPVNGGSQ